MGIRGFRCFSCPILNVLIFDFILVCLPWTDLFHFHLFLVRSTPLRSKASRFWWTNQARVQEEGENHEEDLSQAPVHRLQENPPGCHQTCEALRTCRKEGQEGRHLLRIFYLTVLCMLHFVVFSEENSFFLRLETPPFSFSDFRTWVL